MRKIIIMASMVLCTSVSGQLFSDNLLHSSVDANFSTIKLVGVLDEGSGTTSFTGGTDSRPVDTDYNLVEVNALTSSIAGRIGLSSHLFDIGKFEFRSDINIGIGFRFSLKDALGLEGLIMDVPGYLRASPSSNEQLGFLLGYHYTTGGLRTHLPVVGIEFGDVGDRRIRVYSSVIPYRYYAYYTDGREEPAASIMKFGVEMILAY